MLQFFNDIMLFIVDGLVEVAECRGCNLSLIQTLNNVVATMALVVDLFFLNPNCFSSKTKTQ